MPISLDEFAIHQTPLSMRHVASTDRNFYDRWYFNAHDRTGEVFVVTGGGVYPNLGVRDAFVAVRRGDRQSVTRWSDALDDRSLEFSVGPYRIEVIEPLRRLRVSSDDADIGLDLTWKAAFPAVDEQPHLLRSGARAILHAQRFAQVGSWQGAIRLDGAQIDVDPAVWTGTRDRSWGIRPVGESDPGGRSSEEPIDGFWWLYVPLRFADFAVVVICQEDPTGFRSLNDALRVWPDGRIEQLGWPRVEVRYRPGSRYATGATLLVTDGHGRPVRIEVDASCAVPLAVGCGYTGDPGWSHGKWKGRGWRDSVTFDLSDPSVAATIAFSAVDHVGKAVWHDPDGWESTGWGLFEHTCMGRHDPSGFDDWTSVAP